MTNYEAAREKYAALGVDTDKAIETLKKVPVSLHCWQLDDVIGFDNDGGLTGGIQTTGNYMGRARTPEQLMADMEEAMRLMPGTAKLNIHASYAIFAPGEFADRDALEPKHFAKWVEFAKKHHMGIDFNPTFFSHEKVKDGQTLSSPDEETRRFWINHGKACIRISEYFAKETGMPCVMNIWTGDGFKDVPADRMGPRMRYKDSIEQILSEPYDHNLVKPCVESKVFGIGVESYTVGSAEFTLSFAALHDGCMPLMDNGHYHPLEYVSDKIPAMLCFYPEFALHITRGVRWDSDHVLILDDETKEMAKEIVRDNALDRVYMALDYFDASINRVSALATGFRSWQKALLIALCTPNAMLKALQDTNQMSKLMVMNEAVKMLPIGEIWDEYLRREGVVDDLHFYDENSMLAGEGPLMKDLVEISDHDFNSVNSFSIGIIFVIMIFVLKSISLPVILMCVIEFAIFINMGIPYYTNTVLPFIASIVIGTIQLGATIDYAILITTKYIANRKDGKDKKTSIDEALGTSISSIVVSGLCFFGATFGVGAYSKIEMIGSLCTLMSRGAIISMVTVIAVLPAFLTVFDKIVCKTTVGMKEIKA